MRIISVPAATLLALSVLVIRPASAAEHVEVGKLDCDVSAGIGVIVGFQQDIGCVFTPSASGAVQTYKGKITQFGIDIGEIRKAKMAWLVFAPSSRGGDALSGDYDGVTADAAIGVGLGAKVLVGGEHGTVSLQPVSVEADEGLNIAAGVASLTLRASD